MTAMPMTCDKVPHRRVQSGALLAAQWDREVHITRVDRCRKPMGLEKKKFWDISFLGHAP